MSDFPEDANAIDLISMGLAAGGAGLLMTIWLAKKVS